MKKWILGGAAVIALAGGIGWASLDDDQKNLVTNFPTDRSVLFWDDEQREATFRMMDGIPGLIEARTIPAKGDAYPLPQGEPIDLGVDIDAYMAEQRTAALIVVVDGEVVLEKYGLGFGPEGKWTSFSVAKSLTSTLVGAAVKDGAIRSLDDKVTDYITDMKGSAYDDVTIRQLLTMTSGVAWNEDYTDPQSDAALFLDYEPEEGMDATVSYMRSLGRDAPAGERWLYSTGETNLVGVLVSVATGKQLSDYLSEKIWTPFGMQQDATWLLGDTGHEVSGCCIQASTRDMARFGLFVLGGGKVGDTQVVPDDWFTAATTKQVEIGVEGRGYGFQWWTFDDGSYAAQGIFGQGIFIDPARNLVIASNSNWPVASGNSEYGMQRQQFYDTIKRNLDARRDAAESEE